MEQATPKKIFKKRLYLNIVQANTLEPQTLVKLIEWKQLSHGGFYDPNMRLIT